ncbi:ABC transporter substrate-binding protein [Chloroflexota bacterium]
MKNIWYCLLMLGLAFSLILSGCKAPEKPAPAPKPVPPAAPALTPWIKVVTAAKKEGTVTIYSGGGADVSTAIKEGFSKAYGINAEVVGGKPGELFERIKVESRAGSIAGDIIIFTGVANFLPIVEEGMVVAPAVEVPAAMEKGIWRVEPYGFDPQKMIATVNNSLIPSLLVNTDLIKKDEITSWYDLLDPKWKGNMVMEDPRFPGSGNATLAAFTSLGEDFWTKLAAQDILMLRRMAVIDAIVHGEKLLAIGPSSTRPMAAINAGAPVKLIHLKEGTPSADKGAVLVKDAPHPNAALVLLHWMLTKEGQVAINTALGDPPHKDRYRRRLGISAKALRCCL